MSQSVSHSKFNRVRAVLAALTLVLFAAGSRMNATTLMPMDVAELSDQAEIVFTGTAVKSRVVRSQEGEPYTFVTFAVHDVLKGWAMERQIVLRFTGGDTENGTVSFEGMPQFEQGQTYLLFVHGNGSLICPVLGWWQGQFRFERQPASGKRILIDSAGMPLQGIEQGRFRRGLSERTEIQRGDTGMTVLSEQGVHVELAERALKVRATASSAEAAEATQAPEADRVIAQLRSFIAGRATADTFRPGQRVQSAQPEDGTTHSGLPTARQQ